MPASGPGKSATPSAITGRPKAAKRAGSPLALRMRPSHCGSRRAITRSRMVRPAMVRIGLSPPPILRASPPASRMPGMPPGSVVIATLALALVPRGFLLDIVEVLVVDDTLFARQRDEALAARAPDESEPDLAGEIDAPGRKARARDQDRNPHPHRLDDHFRGEPARGVEDLVRGIDAVA